MPDVWSNRLYGQHSLICKESFIIKSFGYRVISLIWCVLDNHCNETSEKGFYSSVSFGQVVAMAANKWHNANAKPSRALKGVMSVTH